MVTNIAGAVFLADCILAFFLVFGFRYIYGIRLMFRWWGHYGGAHIFAIGSTAAVSTIEYEPGLKEDLSAALERIAPRDAGYKHHLRWGDYNGHSHVRATIIGPSLEVPVMGGKLVLGTWQQIVFIELDVRARSRKVVVTVMGE